MKRRLATINGAPGVALSLYGKAQYAFAFEVIGTRINYIFVICNPDKLSHLTDEV